MINIRRLNVYDAALLAEIHLQSLSSPWSEEAFTTLLQTPCYRGWLALIENQPMGFILVSQIEPEAEIITFAVHPEWRRQQVGQQLLQHFLKNCQGSIQSVFLEVDQTNWAAIQLYTKYGFKQIAVRPDYYQHPTGKFTDAFVLRLILHIPCL